MADKKDFLLKLGEDIMDEQNKLNENNEVGEAYVRKAHEQIKSMFEDEDVSVVLKMHKPFKGVGCISIIGRDELNVYNPELFAAVCERADNVDVYPQLDGAVKMDLSFYGLMSKGVSEVK